MTWSFHIGGYNQGWYKYKYENWLINLSIFLYQCSMSFGYETKIWGRHYWKNNQSMISVGCMHAKRSIKTVISLSPIGTHIPFYAQCYICGFWNHAKECYMLHCQDRYEGFCWDIAAFICFVLWYYTSFIFLVIRIDTFKTFNFVSWNNTTI